MQYGTGEHAYELVDDWAVLPDGESFLDIGSICVIEDDDVLVLNRGATP